MHIHLIFCPEQNAVRRFLFISPLELIKYLFESTNEGMACKFSQEQSTLPISFVVQVLETNKIGLSSCQHIL